MSLPSINVFRERVESVVKEDIRYCLMATYAYCGRISEVVAEAYTCDNTIARGPRGTDVRLDTYPIGETKYDAVVFTVRTAKRLGIERKVAVPIAYESWAMPLYEYYKRFGEARVFPFAQQYVRYWVRKLKVLEGLTYPIETYPIYKDKILINRVLRHTRNFTLHAIRHLRASELVDYYGFNGPELAIYGGWTFRSIGFPSATDRYLSLGWQSYFPRLLKRRIV